MKVVLQSFAEAETQLAEVPTPVLRPGHLRIQTEASLVSLGTERMLVEFAKAGWMEKARQQPDKVRQVLQKIRTDGVVPTLQAVRAKLDQPLTLGYCNAGTVLDVAPDVTGFSTGDHVVSNGPHAEIVVVPANLCARIPAGVSFEEAPFTVLGAVALQGLRLAGPTLGESVAVTGLGLVGLLSVQLLRAAGCRVLGIDFDSSKCALARQFGAETVDLSRGEDAVKAGLRFSQSRGMDAVLITASTQSNDPVHQGALMLRKRGRIVLVGMAGLQLSRADFYEKELSFQVSCSYGPGRYDEQYELRGHDYPVGFVRWTEQRNFEAVLNLLADQRLNVQPLISHRLAFADALQAYDPAALGKALGIVLHYRATIPSSSQTAPPSSQSSPGTAFVHLGSSRTATVPEVVVGVIGAGNFTGQILLPALHRTGARLRIIASASGVSSTHLGRKYGFEASTTEPTRVFADEQVNTVLITTRHSSHGRLVLEGLKAGKRVYVEKPLCLSREELDAIVRTYQSGRRTGEAEPFLMVGFNRRFAPQSLKSRDLLAAVKDAKSFIYTVNAGALSNQHWSQNAAEGGGRIIGEACHFIDLLRFLVGATIRKATVVQLGERCPSGLVDTLSFTLTFVDGSIGTVHYFANGHRSFPKERLEMFSAGRVLQLDNFRRLTGYGWPGFRQMRLWSQDKGHVAEMQALVEAVRNGRGSPIPFQELTEVANLTFEIDHQARNV